MNTAQRTFVGTAWLFIVLAGLLFLVPTSFPSVEGAAWACLTVGAVSHLALLAAIIFDLIPTAGNTPPADG